jgi:hypothetical protein
LRHLEKAKWESLDFERGSLVERTRAPSSAREEAESNNEVPLVSIEEGGVCGPFGPQNLFLFNGLSLHDCRPDHGEKSKEEEEKGLVLRK